MNDRIAVLIPTMAGGGAERVFLNLIKGFVREGVNVDLLLLDKEGSYVNEIPNEVRIIELEGGRVIKMVPSLIRYLKSAKPMSLLVAMNYVNVIAIIAKFIARSETKVVITEHNNRSIAASNNRGPISSITKLLMKIFYPYADEIVAVSNGVADDLVDYASIARAKITTIYNPVITDELIEKSKESVDHEWFNSNVPVVIGVGRLNKQKGFDVLIKAFELVRKEIKAKLIIFGEGEQRHELQNLIKNKNLGEDILLYGFVSNPYKYMRNANLYVLSSNFEGLPTVLIEALACDTPVISTDCPSGPQEILAGGKFGTIVEVGNSEELANAIVGHLRSDMDLTKSDEHQKKFKSSFVTKEYLKLLIN